MFFRRFYTVFIVFFIGHCDRHDRLSDRHSHRLVTNTYCMKQVKDCKSMALIQNVPLHMGEMLLCWIGSRISICIAAARDMCITRYPLKHCTSQTFLNVIIWVHVLEKRIILLLIPLMYLPKFYCKKNTCRQNVYAWIRNTAWLWVCKLAIWLALC